MKMKTAYRLILIPLLFIPIFIFGCSEPETIEDQKRRSALLIGAAGFSCDRITHYGSREVFKDESIREVKCGNDAYYIKINHFLDLYSVCHKGVCRRI